MKLKYYFKLQYVFLFFFSFFLFFISYDVKAEQIGYFSNPQSMSLVATDNSLVNVSIVTADENATYFYGYFSGGAGDRKGAFWRYNTSGSFGSYPSTVNLSFSLYIDDAFSNTTNINQLPSRVVWVTNSGNVYSCYTSATPTTTRSHIYPFYCPKVTISSNSDMIIHTNSFATAKGNFYGISNVSYIHDDSENMADDIRDIRDNSESQKSELEEQTKTQKEQKEFLESDDTSYSESQASSFFGDFESNDYGLSGIITSPLNFIKSLSSASCSPLHWNFGWFDDEFTLPCVSSIVSSNWPEFLTIYQTITFGIVAYMIIIKIFGLVKGFKDPDSDKVEVLEL